MPATKQACYSYEPIVKKNIFVLVLMNKHKNKDVLNPHSLHARNSWDGRASYYTWPRQIYAFRPRLFSDTCIMRKCGKSRKWRVKCGNRGCRICCRRMGKLRESKAWKFVVYFWIVVVMCMSVVIRLWQWLTKYSTNGWFLFVVNSFNMSLYACNNVESLVPM